VCESLSRVRATRHLPVRVSPLKVVKNFIRRPPRAFESLGKTSAYARYGVEMVCDFLIRAGIEEHGLGFALHGKHQRASGFLHALHHRARVA
jgi:hypothetical protein